ncbi:MAG: hypothetical protein FWG34_15420 [Oscillospiraceae bacterium]|nr:hypothetical protein [Oscillospiraceae bacterium]
MKIRTDFVTNSSESSYILAKRLIVHHGSAFRIPIEVSHTVDGENLTRIYFVNGSYEVDDEILEAAYREDDVDSIDERIDNAKLSELVSRFWNNEAEIIKQFYEDEVWHIDEHDRYATIEHIEKYCVFGSEYSGDYCYSRNYSYRIYSLYFPDMKEGKYESGPRFEAYSTRDSKSFSYFNKYVRGTNVYLYNTVYKILPQDAEFIYNTVELMLSACFENSSEIARILREKNLYPLFVGVLPHIDSFPTIPTDIWLLAWNSECESIVDMFSVELSELENWLSEYETPSFNGSLWESIQEFIEKYANGKNFYDTEGKYYTRSTQYKQYWDWAETGDVD